MKNVREINLLHEILKRRRKKTKDLQDEEDEVVVIELTDSPSDKEDSSRLKPTMHVSRVR